MKVGLAEQAAKAPPSRLHSKVTGLSLLESVNVAEVCVVTLGGPVTMVAVGAVVSTFQAQGWDGALTLLAASVARTTSVCGPSATVNVGLAGQGANASPFDAMNGLRGLRTLGVRLQRQSETAQRVAEVLEAHPAVSEVRYPGLASHPQHELAQRQMALPGGLITFDLSGGLEAGRTFVESTRVAQLATSLGGPETLVTHPASTTHVNLTPDELAANGITEGTVRVSIGLEHVDDVIADFVAALS